MAWLKFESINPDLFQPGLMLNNYIDSNFFEPFGGLHNGFQFGGGAPEAVGTTADQGTQWQRFSGAHVRVCDDGAGMY